MSDPGPIHPKNASGPFYVVNDCCMACGVPTSIAPELFDVDSSDHCYVTRQPYTPNWLRSTKGVERIRRYAEEAWNRSGEWQSRPW